MVPETIKRLTQVEPPPSLTLENFAPGYDASFHPECRTAAAEVIRFIESTMSGGKQWCALVGVSGVGKTMLARAANQYLSEHGKNARFLRWITIVDYMRKGDYGVIDHVCEAKVAFIDDIGAGYETALSKAKILEIAERRTGKPTFWTSNLTAQQIADQIDVRVASRMVRDGNRVFQFSECLDWSILNYGNDQAHGAREAK
jgi:DNA replication protein DnaC